MSKHNQEQKAILIDLMNSEPLMSAEELLEKTIENYNSKVSQVYRFQFNKTEKEMFLNMMNYHTQWHLNNVKGVVCDEAECEMTKWGTINEVDKQSITNAFDNYITNNLK